MSICPKFAAIVGTAPSSYIPPFEETFGGGLQNSKFFDPGEACVRVGMTFHDREGVSTAFNTCSSDCPIASGNNYLCYQTALITFNQNDVLPGVPSSIFGSTSATNVPTGYPAGWFFLSFPDIPASDGLNEILRPSNAGQVFNGSPVIGFLFRPNPEERP